jgi:hypothetical protein
MSRSVVSLFFGQSKERSISPFKMSEQRALSGSTINGSNIYELQKTGKKTKKN